MALSGLGFVVFALMINLSEEVFVRVQCSFYKFLLRINYSFAYIDLQMKQFLLHIPLHEFIKANSTI